jgi:hypothetical protein
VSRVRRGREAGFGRLSRFGNFGLISPKRRTAPVTFTVNGCVVDRSASAW